MDVSASLVLPSHATAMVSWALAGLLLALLLVGNVVAYVACERDVARTRHLLLVLLLLVDVLGTLALFDALANGGRGPALTLTVLLLAPVLALVVVSLTARRRPDDGEEGEDGGGGGGGGGGPGPQDPGGPPWWPEFERDFRRYAAQARFGTPPRGTAGATGGPPPVRSGPRA